jgi:hypothetical protein
MNTDDNIVEFTGDWQGDKHEMTDEEFTSAMEELLMTQNEESLGRTIAGVLEFLTVRAVLDGPFYLLTDDEQAITVIAANEDAIALKDLLPNTFKSWEDNIEDEFITNADPGDEQDESATKSE